MTGWVFGAKKYNESIGLEVGTDVCWWVTTIRLVAELIGLSSVQCAHSGLIASKVIALLLADINRQRPADHHIVLKPTLVLSGKQF